MHAIDSSLLKTFSVVAETEHITRAAERLNCVQSAVSMQIKRLEESLQVRLFERRGRGIKLTQEGHILLRHARRMTRLTDETLLEIGRRVSAGRIRIGITDITMRYMSRILERLHARYPMIDIDMRCNRSWEALDALDSGDVDLAFVTQHDKRKGARRVGRTPFVWVCAQSSDVHLRDPLPLAIFGPGCIYRKSTLAALDKCGIDYRLAYESPSGAGLDCAVKAGLAVTIAPKNLITPDMRILTRRDLPVPRLPMLNTYIFVNPSSPASINEVVIQSIVDTVRNWED